MRCHPKLLPLFSLLFPPCISGTLVRSIRDLFALELRSHTLCSRLAPQNHSCAFCLMCFNETYLQVP